MWEGIFLNKTLYRGAGVVLVSLVLFLLLPNSSTHEEMTLAEYLDTDFSGITRIDVRYGDGNQMTIEDAATLHELIALLEETRLIKANAPVPVGSLYYLDLTIRTQTVRYSRQFYRDHAAYHAMDPQAKQLDERVIKLGRENIPGLLPGVEL